MDMQKVKDVQAAAEKLRREKWIDEKTKKIKVRTLITYPCMLCIS